MVGAKDPLISTMNMIQPGTGLIIAMAQSRPVMGCNAKKGQTYWNLAVDPAMGGIQGYQAGSTFKAFTRGCRVGEGDPAQQADTTPRSPMNFSGRSFDILQRAASHVFGSWRVRNSTGHNGNMDMYSGAASGR